MLITAKEKRPPRGVALVLCAGAALLAVIALNINLNPAEPPEDLSPFLSAVTLFCNSFPNANESFLLIVEWCGAYALLLLSARHRFDRSSLCVAVLFSLTMVLGYPIQETGTLAMLYDGPVQILKTLLCFAGHLALSYCLVRTLFATLDSATQSAAPTHAVKQAGALERHPFALPFLVVLVAWMPLIAGYAPGVFMGDTSTQLCMWLGLDHPKAHMVNLISPDVTMTSHYPPIHTAMFGSLFQLGLAISGNPNIGVLCYAAVQTLIALCSISYAHMVALRLGAKRSARIAVLLLIGFTPWYADFAILVTRDTVFASMLLIFCLQLLLLTKQPDSRSQIQTWVILAVSGILAALFRSGGVVVVGAGLIALIILVRKDHARLPLKASIVSSCAVAIVCLSVTNILYPALSIPSGNIGEMLSIPYQQTARFVKDHPEELERWERSAIDAVLGYEGLANRYVPTKSDKVKDYAATNRHNVTSEQLMNFFRAYLAMGLRDPGCYALATMNNYYGYFYPAKNPVPFYGYSWSKQRMGDAKRYTGFDLHHVGNPLIKRLARIDSAYIEVFRSVPFLNFLMKSSTWVWILILATAYALRKKWVHTAPALVTLWAVTLIFLAGPCNGADYNRYVYPLAVVLPFLLIAFPITRRQSA